jgi:hypothetical protein
MREATTAAKTRLISLSGISAIMLLTMVAVQAFPVLANTAA